MKLINIVENLQEEYRLIDLVFFRDDYGQELWSGPLHYVPLKWLDTNIKLIKFHKNEIEVYI